MIWDLNVRYLWPLLEIEMLGDEWSPTCCFSLHWEFAEDKQKMGDDLRRWHNFRRLSNGYFSCCLGFQSSNCAFLVDSEGSCLVSPLLVDEKVVLCMHLCVGGRGSTYFNCCSDVLVITPIL